MTIRLKPIGEASDPHRPYLFKRLETTAFLAPFLTRFGGEGFYDTRRDEQGNVKPSDVGAPTDRVT